MTEIGYWWGRWPGADDRFDRLCAMGTSLGLHLLGLLLLLGGLGTGVSTRSTFQGLSEAQANGPGSSEFRQRLVLVSVPPPPPKKTPTAAETKSKPKPDDVSAAPTLALEQPLDAHFQVSPGQATTGVVAKETPPADDPLSTTLDSSSESQTRETSAGATGGGSSSEQLLAAYVAALKESIQGKWSLSPNHHGSCSITVKQTLGGNVSSVIARDCDLDEADRLSLEAAALMAQPLPYSGFESVFSEDITLDLNQ